MFQRLFELSHCLAERPAWERLNEGMPANYDRGLALCFGAAGEWRGVKTFMGNQSVVYRSGPPNGTDFTPCCKLAGNTANRLAAAVQTLADHGGLPAEKRQWLVDSLDCFNQAQATIWAEVEAGQQAAGIDGKDHRGYVYWADDQMAPVYAWPETQAMLVERALTAFADKGGERAKGCCAVCGQTPVTVYGNYAVLACYNLNNPGSIAGGFRAGTAHRNFPVCGDCALSIAETFTFAECNLSSSMAGQSYLILPYSNHPEVRDELRARLSQRPDRYQLGKARDLLADELALTQEFAGVGDQLALALIFFKQQNAAWRIQAEVQQLLPSRLHALLAAGKTIAAAADLTAESKTEIKPVLINAQTFKNFSSAGEKPSEETLRGWLAALFAEQTVDTNHLLHCLVAKLLGTGKRNPEFLHWMTRQAWGLYRYAQQTGLILPEPVMEHPAMSATIPNSPYGRYTQEHADFFRNPELIVAFLTGCYASQVASVQRQERGADPFTKKFIGRLLTRQQLQRLYREGHGKLAQYGKLGYVITGLDPDLANAWVACGEHWAISDEAATFAFTIGYSLAYRIVQLDKAAAEPGAPSPG
ncbi:TM1802 family CRISPR-associated protein [uncultured Lamprocystis sp.]|jgi:CRISPR-associated protein Cas8b/Csh1 subtype I-B|uniref:TM1802 family CRISPR-associated protein n=1 Tax=uncultured Lamprocystis sp. TaxID=543132 RepID=UPI0025F52753|nr:TM1802 family CRISPR-associated protein [uncultured Lamprocystis sp.]